MNQSVQYALFAARRWLSWNDHLPAAREGRRALPEEIGSWAQSIVGPMHTQKWLVTPWPESDG